MVNHWMVLMGWPLGGNSRLPVHQHAQLLVELNFILWVLTLPLVHRQGFFRNNCYGDEIEIAVFEGGRGIMCQCICT